MSSQGFLALHCINGIARLSKGEETSNVLSILMVGVVDMDVQSQDTGPDGGYKPG